MRKSRLLKLMFSRLKAILFLIEKRKFKMAYNYIWVSLFTRDSGAAILDPLYCRFPGLVPYPEAIEVETTTRCNLRCTICEHTYWNEKGRDMTFAEFKSIIDQFPKLKWIGLTGIGSSFLNKDYPAMLQYLKSKSVYVELFDSFTQLDEKMSRQLVEIGVDKVCLSMEAATKETYEEIRVGANFENVLQNVKTMLCMKKEMKTPIPEVWFHYIVNSKNYQEMPQFIELVHSLGAGETGGSLLYWTDLLSFNETAHLQIKVPDDIWQEVLKNGKKLGIEMWWNPDFTPSEPISKCVRWSEPFILVTGHVQPCCVINEANQRDFQKACAVANVLEKPFKEIWRNEYKKCREQILQGKVPAICRYCRVFDLNLSRGKVG